MASVSSYLNFSRNTEEAFKKRIPRGLPLGLRCAKKVGYLSYGREYFKVS